jgi:hypothetical protein
VSGTLDNATFNCGRAQRVEPIAAQIPNTTKGRIGSNKRQVIRDAKITFQDLFITDNKISEVPQANSGPSELPKAGQSLN